MLADAAAAPPARARVTVARLVARRSASARPRAIHIQRIVSARLPQCQVPPSRVVASRAKTHTRAERSAPSYVPRSPRAACEFFAAMKTFRPAQPPNRLI